MKTTTNENRPGRFANLLSGGAKPRRSFALMMALVLVGMLSLAGVVSADEYFKGVAPTTITKGTVDNGDFWVDLENTWTSPDNIGTEQASASFTLPVDPSDPGVTIEFAHLYVVVYSGSQSANYKGNETVVLNNGQDNTLASAYPLDLEYDRTVGPTYGSVSAPFTSLSRVTSDYLSIFDVKDFLTTQDISVVVTTTNESGRFDGRIKEVKLAVAYDDGTGSTTTYYVNEGHDAVSYYSTIPYVGQSEFNDTGSTGTGTLYVDYIASADGTYTWNGNPITATDSIVGNQAGLKTYTVSLTDDNYLSYNRTGNYYKIAAAFLKF